MGLKYKLVVDRMKSAPGIRNDSDIARSLDITPQALSNFKKRGEIPSDLVIKFADKFKLSVDWLISGKKHQEVGTGSPEDHTKDAIKEWIDEFWAEATEEEKNWFKVQFGRCFPDYANAQESDKSGSTKKKRK